MSLSAHESEGLSPERQHSQESTSNRAKSSQYQSILALQITAGNDAVKQLLAGRYRRSHVRVSSWSPPPLPIQRRAAVPGESIPAFLPALMRKGAGDVKVAEENALDEARVKLRGLAARLLEVQLKADALQPMTAGDQNLASQQQLLVDHLDRVTAWLRSQLATSLVDSTVWRAIGVGIDAGSLAADLVYLDRLGVSGGMSRVSRAGANRGLAWTWKVMRSLAADTAWAVNSQAEADEAIREATFHVYTLQDILRNAGLVKAGVEAAQLADLAVSAPRLVATGSQVLKALATWLTKGGGGGGMLRLATTGGSRTFVLLSGGRTLVLTAEQIQALAQAGILSGKALALYHMAASTGSGSPSGPYGERPPGSKSRYSDEEITKEYLKEVGKKVPTGERAAEELGVTARQLRKLHEHHHLLVQQLRKWFKSRGVNIDKFTLKLTADEHRWIHNEYRWNDLWIDFRLKNPKASPKEIRAAMEQFQKQVGLEGLKLVPYPR
ncbi:MAG: TIGR02269 family lipoprotein [Acidobacteria bacterium]|nr:TIGR02269 family lipoprotein [Acidobacteriota bacterium]